MQRREVLRGLGAGFAIAAVLPEIHPCVDLTDEELAAVERIVEKVESGRVADMYKAKIVGGTTTTINVEIEWTDPNMVMLRQRGVFK